MHVIKEGDRDMRDMRTQEGGRVESRRGIEVGGGNGELRYAIMQGWKTKRREVEDKEKCRRRAMGYS